MLKETSTHPAKDQSSAVSTRDCCMLTGQKSAPIQAPQGKRKTSETAKGQVILGPGAERARNGKFLHSQTEMTDAFLENSRSQTQLAAFVLCFQKATH